MTILLLGIVYLSVFVIAHWIGNAAGIRKGYRYGYDRAIADQDARSQERRRSSSARQHWQAVHFANSLEDFKRMRAPTAASLDETLRQAAIDHGTTRAVTVPEK